MRNLLLVLTLMIVATGGCEDRSQPAPPQKPPVVRKKITMVKEAPVEVAKPTEVEEAPIEVAKPTEVEEAPVEAPKPTAIGEVPVKVVTPPGEKVVRLKIAEPPAAPAPEAPVAVKEAEEIAPEVEGVRPPPLEPPKAEPPKVELRKVEPPKKEEKPPAPAEKPAREVLEEVFVKKSDYTYDPAGKPDPFKPLFQARAEPAAPPEEEVKKVRLPLTPLQKIALSQLKLVGIIVSPTGNKALVEEPSGKAYIITKDTLIGQNFGRVTKILQDRIIVEEEIKDLITGKTELQTTELTLRKKVGDV